MYLDIKVKNLNLLNEIEEMERAETLIGINQKLKDD